MLRPVCIWSSSAPRRSGRAFGVTSNAARDSTAAVVTFVRAVVSVAASSTGVCGRILPVPSPEMACRSCRVSCGLLGLQFHQFDGRMPKGTPSCGRGPALRSSGSCRPAPPVRLDGARIGVEAKGSRTCRCTEWRPRRFFCQFGGRGGAAIGELIVRPRECAPSTNESK